MIIPILIILFFILIISIKLYLKKNKEGIELLFIITSLFTIFSVLFSLGVFLDEQNQQKLLKEEYNKIISEGLEEEIDLNLDLIYAINKTKERYRNTTENEIKRFDYYYLDKVQDKDIFEKETRNLIINVIRDIKRINKVMDMVESIPLQNESDYQLKGQYVDYLTEGKRGLNKLDKDLRTIEEKLISQS